MSWRAFLKLPEAGDQGKEIEWDLVVCRDNPMLLVRRNSSDRIPESVERSCEQLSETEGQPPPRALGCRVEATVQDPTCRERSIESLTGCRP